MKLNYDQQKLLCFFISRDWVAYSLLDSEMRVAGLPTNQLSYLLSQNLVEEKIMTMIPTNIHFYKITLLGIETARKNCKHIHTNVSYTGDKWCIDCNCHLEYKKEWMH